MSPFLKTHYLESYNLDKFLEISLNIAVFIFRLFKTFTITQYIVIIYLFFVKLYNSILYNVMIRIELLSIVK